MRAPVFLLALLLAGCVTAPDKDQNDPWPRVHDAAATELGGLVAEGTTVRFETNHGNITMWFYDALLPETTAHIIDLVESGFYDGTIVHRVVDDFVIQGGDPSGTGVLGSGETVPMERDEGLVFAAGAVGLARDLDPDSGDSQWFITEKPASHLHDPQGTTGAVFGAYALFAQVTAGMDVVREIAGQPVIPGLDRPIQDVVLLRAQTLENADRGDPRAVVQTYHTDFVTSAGTGSMQMPLYPVAEEAMPLALYVDTPDADIVDLWFEDATGARMDIALSAAPEDASTFVGEVTLPHAGTWTVGAEQGAAFEVRVLSPTDA